jgi:ABC-2 type transport system ATP-binding protein
MTSALQVNSMHLHVESSSTYMCASGGENRCTAPGMNSRCAATYLNLRERTQRPAIVMYSTRPPNAPIQREHLDRLGGKLRESVTAPSDKLRHTAARQLLRHRSSGVAMTAAKFSSTDRDPAVVVESLTVTRGTTTVLQSLNLTIHKGMITGLLGPSGCGKTTLMRCIVGAQLIKSGTVAVLRKPAGDKALRGRIGYATQAASIYPDITVLENLRYFAALFSVNRDRVNTVLENVGLTDYRGQVARDLSGGQRGRLSLACALIGDPEVLILDEPTVGLDPVLRVQIWDMFAELCEAGKTIVVSSHVMDEADRCEELILMRDGNVLAHEPPSHLLRRSGTDDLESAFLKLVNSSVPESDATTREGMVLTPDPARRICATAESTT